MAFSISIKADGESPIMAVLTKLTGFDKSAMFDGIGSYGVQSTQDRFQYQHDVEGNPWKQSWRSNMQGGNSAGRNIGDLVNGLNYQLRPNGVEWGANVEYAHVFHFGAHILPKTAQYLVFNVLGNWRKVKEVNIPARPFLGINADDERMILDIIEEHILG